jgi:Lon protease-like protein
MKLNRTFANAAELPPTLPAFPVAGALLLPRRPIQLTVFEPRYLALLDDALSGERLIGMIQPKAGDDAVEPNPELCEVGCLGRIVQYAEIGDGRCFLSLMGVTRFHVAGEMTTLTPYRILRADYSLFTQDFVEGAGEADVDRDSLVKALRDFAKANDLKIDWDEIANASNETLVNSLAIMSPYGAREKQAMLEAVDLRSRAEVLVAIAQFDMAGGSETPRHLH